MPEIIKVRDHSGRLIKIARLPKDVYDDFLASEEWERQRTEALEQAGHRCRRCGATEHLHVHHRDYFRYEDDPEWMIRGHLEVVCRMCHQLIHGRRFHPMGPNKFVIGGFKI